MRVGAIDVGTNSTRLLIAEASAESLKEIERDLVMTRLGQGVDHSGSLAPEAIRRTVAAIEDYDGRCRAAGVDRVRIGATSAARDAANRDVFLNAVRSATGRQPDVLSGEEEAALSFTGATLGLAEAGPFLVVDMGGGSTEFVVGEQDVRSWVSLDTGSVRLTERHVRHDPPTPEEISELRAQAEEAVVRARSAVGSSARTLVGLAGTITTVAAVAFDLPGYVREAIHHARLSAEQVASVAARLASMTNAGRRALPAMPQGREDVIVAGATLLVAIMEGFGFGEILVSETDILDGLALSLLE